MTGPAYTASTALLEAMREAGARYAFANLGSDHTGIMETYARAAAAGSLDSLPELILCPHESVALSAAHGYAHVEMRTAFFPLVVMLNGLGNLVLKRFGIDRQAESTEHLYSPEELALLVEESAEGGQLRADASQMLRDLFAFGDLSAREAMVPRVKVTGIPVGAEADEIRGIVSSNRSRPSMWVKMVRDWVRRSGTSGRRPNLLATTDLWPVPSTRKRARNSSPAVVRRTTPSSLISKSSTSVRSR